MKRPCTVSLIISLFITLITSYSYAEPNNLSTLKNEIRQYHDSGEYEQEIKNQIDDAKHFLLAQIQYYENHKTNKKLALVLDIDETSLSNYNAIVNSDFTGNPVEIHKHILAANSPAIKATLELYQLALKNKVAVFFVTGRRESELKATQKNLTAAGFKNWAGIYVRPNEYKKHSITDYKAECRKKIEAQGYLIVESIGDQDSDIKGGYTLKGFKLPNPFYYIP